MVERSRLAVLGSPIAHSRSPDLHTAAYRMLGLDWSYERIELDEPRLEPFVTGMDASWRGLSLTMPLKHEAARLATVLDAPASLTGAVNTLLPVSADRSLRGFNTDVGGITAAVRTTGVARVGTVVILGSGATAASALPACAELGAGHVVVVARSIDKAEGLRPLAERVGVQLEIRALDGYSNGVSADLMINTIPGDAAAASAWSDPVCRSALLLDVPYDPWPSPLARAWLSGGGTVISGLAMLVHQALLQVRIFVMGDPAAPLSSETEVLAAMQRAAGLDPAGHIAGL